jgi:4-amino-4-deoxy-L-arabinose transferase-like glycosyltransferase
MLDRLKLFFNPQPGTGDADTRAPWRIFWVALAVRLAYMTLAHTYRIRLAQDHFEYGWEMGRIARALVSGRGYADPFANGVIPHTGPTAWVPPAYPLVIAAVFELFGVYTKASAWVLLAINSILSAATAMAVWEIGWRFANRRVALWSAWLWALYPAAMQYAVRWVWEMTLTTALFAWVIVLALRMRAEPEARVLARWTWFGLAWGIIALSNSTLLLFLPVCGVWILLGSRQLRHSMAGASIAGVLFLAIVAPWTARNWLVFQAFIPLRGNLGAEMYMGNGPDAEGLLMEYNHPFQSAEQLRLYAKMGEVAYVKMRGAVASAAIASDPSRFVRNTVKRVYFFWVSVPHPSGDRWYVEFFRVLNFSFVSLSGLLGLALALYRRKPGAGLFAWAFVLLPVPYYVVTAHARFRHPLEPLICVLAVFLFQAAETTGTGMKGMKTG